MCGRDCDAFCVVVTSVVRVVRCLMSVACVACCRVLFDVVFLLFCRRCPLVVVVVCCCCLMVLLDVCCCRFVLLFVGIFSLSRYVGYC